MTAKLGPEAERALINVGTNRQGATLNAREPASVTEQLRMEGLIGRDGGLTQAGSIERERLVSRRLDDLF